MAERRFAPLRSPCMPSIKYGCSAGSRQHHPTALSPLSPLPARWLPIVWPSAADLHHVPPSRADGGSKSGSGARTRFRKAAAASTQQAVPHDRPGGRRHGTAAATTQPAVPHDRPGGRRQGWSSDLLPQDLTTGSRDNSDKVAQLAGEDGSGGPAAAGSAVAARQAGAFRPGGRRGLGSEPPNRGRGGSSGSQEPQQLAPWRPGGRTRTEQQLTGQQLTPGELALEELAQVTGNPAADESIAKEQQLHEFEPLPEEARPNGLTPKEWHTYQAEWRANQLAKNLQAAIGAEAAAAIDEAMCPGGYHPVQVGELFNSGRYAVMHFLGQGHYSTVWMVRDTETGQQAAMKVVRSAQNYTEAARDEVMLLQQIRDNDPEDASHCVRLLDQFEHCGPHGRHVCEVFEPMGDDLLTLIRVYEHRGIPLHIVRHLTSQTLVALEYLHTKCNIVHTDLKPENVMLTDSVRPRGSAPGALMGLQGMKADELEPRLMSMGCKIVDFGNACWTDRQFSQNIQTRQYRSPEVILGAGYDDSADIWSLACMVFELVTGDFLFQPNARGTYSKDEDHLAQMIELLGDFPPAVAVNGKHSKEYFTPAGTLRNIEELNLWPLEQVLQEKYFLPAEEAKQLCDFLLPMLHFDPSKRASAAEMLQHPWLAQNQAAPVRCANERASAPRPSPVRDASFTPPANYRRRSPNEQFGAAR